MILEEQVFGFEVGEKMANLFLFNLTEDLRQPLSFDWNPAMKIDFTGQTLQSVMQDRLSRTFLADDKKIAAVAIAQGGKSVLAAIMEFAPSAHFVPNRRP